MTGSPDTSTESISGNTGENRNWKRWIVMGHTAFYVVVSVTTAFALLQRDVSGSQRGQMLGLVLLFSAWYWLIIARHPQWWRQPVPMLIYVTGALVLWLGLTLLSPSYLFLIFILYPLIFGFLPLAWAIAASIILQTLWIWRQATIAGQPLSASGSLLLIGVATVIFNILLTVWIESVVRQSSERLQLIGELQTTRHELAVAEHQAGILAERQRLARDIHDTLAQGFISIVMHLEVAEQLLPPELSEVQQHLKQAKGTARESLGEARRFVWALRPEALERNSLPEALKRLTERWSVESGISATASRDGDPYPLRPEVEVTLLRAAQEAFANIRKHANARCVSLTLSYMDDVLILDIQDDGVGFIPIYNESKDQEYGGFGLVAMRRRVEQLGGTVVIESTPGEGTTIVIEIPIPVNQQRGSQEAQ